MSWRCLCLVEYDCRGGKVWNGSEMAMFVPVARIECVLPLQIVGDFQLFIFSASSEQRNQPDSSNLGPLDGGVSVGGEAARKRLQVVGRSS